MVKCFGRTVLRWDTCLSNKMAFSGAQELFSPLKKLPLPLLGLDVGEKRTGIAYANNYDVAVFLRTLEHSSKANDSVFLKTLVQEKLIKGIVVGWPLQLDGSEGVQCERVKKFCMRDLVPLGIPIHSWDERFSSQFSERMIRGCDIDIKKRKKMIDANSAVFILQGYIDRMRYIESL